MSGSRSAWSRTKTIYDLAVSGGTLDGDKIEGFLSQHPSGARALIAPLRPDQAAAIGTPFLREVFEILRSRFDFVLVDTPPAFTAEVIAAVDVSTHLCVVGMLDALSLKDTKIGLETLEQMGYDPNAVTFVLNRADSDVGIAASDVEELLGRAPDLMVGSDRAIPRALTSGQPIVVAEPRSKAARSYASLAERYLSATARPAEPHRRSPPCDERQRAATAPAAEGELAMELHERIAASPVAAAVAASNGNGSDPFAELKNRIHLALVSELGPRLFDVEDGGAVRSRVESEIRDQLAQESGLSHDDRQRLGAEIADDIFGYGPLERLLADPSVSEIMVNGPKDIWIERAGRLSETPLTFTDASHLRRIITKMVGQIGRRIDESSPLVDARLPDGSRVNAIIPPLSLSGPLLTIRKFAQNRFALSELIEIGTLSKESAEFLENCIRAQLNILVSGGTGTGKTTFLNALSAAIPDSDRIVTIEDAAELQLAQRHVIRLESRPKNIEGEGEITIRDLVRNALRMRPDRIIVGEVRGAEALDMLQAMNTGHEGSLSTVHANSPRDALNRLETMVLMAGYELPLRAIRSHVSSALELVIQLDRLDDGSRRIVEISEVQRMEGEVITLQKLFEFKIEHFDSERRIVGRLHPTGLRPGFLGKFERHGIELPVSLFGGAASASSARTHRRCRIASTGATGEVGAHAVRRRRRDPRPVRRSGRRPRSIRGGPAGSCHPPAVPRARLCPARPGRGRARRPERRGAGERSPGHRRARRPAREQRAAVRRRARARCERQHGRPAGSRRCSGRAGLRCASCAGRRGRRRRVQRRHLGVARSDPGRQRAATHARLAASPGLRNAHQRRAHPVAGAPARREALVRLDRPALRRRGHRQPALARRGPRRRQGAARARVHRRPALRRIRRGAASQNR